jgi:TonB family protein
MIAFMNYLIEANLSLLVLLAFHKVVFHKETNFSFQRYFLLSGIVFSLAVPLFHFSKIPSGMIPVFSDGIPLLSIPEVEFSNTSKSWFNSSDILWGIYLTGVAIFAIIFLSRIVKLIGVIRSTPIVTVGRFKIIESKNFNGTFSFFHFIFIGGAETISATEKQQIVDHEQVHARKLHSLDVLVLNLLSIVFWFNPFIPVYKKSFIQLHEFEADARAVKNHDVNTYCNLLARVALQSFGFSLANHFNNSLTIKRIAMIKSIKKKIRGWKLFLSATLFLCMFYLLACNDQVAEKSPSVPRPEAKKDQASKLSSDQVYLVVEEPPTYPGGLDKLELFIQQNLKYPKKAVEKGLEGTVYISFIVEKDGTVSESAIVKGIDEECDAEALRVVEQLEPWTPGKQSGKEVRVKFVVPIKFKL